MKKRNLLWIYKISMIAVPLAVIAMLLYAKVLQLHAHSIRGTHLLINEVMADNLSAWKDENGVYADWIELYNPTDQTVSLEGYYLSDTKNELTKWAFPDVSIESGGYLIVFCDGNLEEGSLHANFFINAGKETLYLSDQNENVIDSMRIENQQCDLSYGRMYGNSDEMGFLPYSTPLEPNPAYFIKNNEPRADWGEVCFSLEGGLYDESIEVELRCDVEDALILYTLDGSEPDINANIYEKPIRITDAGRPNQYTTKKCVLFPSSNAYNADTDYGVNEVYKATVIRARILKDAKLSNSIGTNTYFINSKYSLPIVSLTTDPYELFDDTEGEYVLGYTYYTMRKYGKNLAYVNSNRGTKLTGHVEIYDTDGSVFEDDMTYSIAGNTSLSQNIQKSFDVVLEHNKITGDMFSASDDFAYEGFSLRGTGCSEVMANIITYPSAFVSNFISDENVGGQKSRFCILFIDGEYWGIYSLMEPKGKEYLSEHAGVSKKDIDLVKPWDPVWDKSFEQLFYEIKEREFYEKADYDWICTKIDMENFMAFILAETFFGNIDALELGTRNVYIWREGGGLWKWQIFDFDSTMLDNDNYLERILNLEIAENETQERINFSTWLLQRLWRSREFRDDFSLYVRLQCKGLYTRENVLSAFEEHIRIYEPELQENLLRCEKGYTKWQQFSYRLRGKDTTYDNYTMDDWKKVVNDQYQFLSDRTERMLEFMEELEGKGKGNAD